MRACDENGVQGRTLEAYALDYTAIFILLL
jgi:hypothetical protein